MSIHVAGLRNQQIGRCRYTANTISPSLYTICFLQSETAYPRCTTIETSSASAVAIVGTSLETPDRTPDRGCTRVNHLRLGKQVLQTFYILQDRTPCIPRSLRATPHLHLVYDICDWRSARTGDPMSDQLRKPRC